MQRLSIDLSKVKRFITARNIITLVLGLAIVGLTISQIVFNKRHDKEIVTLKGKWKEESLQLEREYFDLKGLVSEEALRSRDMKFLAQVIRKFQPKYPPSLVYKISNEIYQNAKAHDNLTVSFVAAVITAESAFDYKAVSKRWDEKKQKWVVVGAEGLMQLMPLTFAIYKKAYNLRGSSFNIHNNVVSGCNHLSDLIDNFRSLNNALIAYNAGEGYTRYWLSHGGRYKDLIEEPREYVRRINDFYDKYRSAIGGDIQVAIAP